MTTYVRLVVNGKLRNTVDLVHKFYYATEAVAPVYRAMIDQFAVLWQGAMEQTWSSDVGYQSINLYLAGQEGPGITRVPNGWPFGPDRLIELGPGRDTVKLFLQRESFTYPKWNLTHLPPPALDWLEDGLLLESTVADLEQTFAFLAGSFTSGGSQLWTAVIANADESVFGDPDSITVKRDLGDLKSRRS